MIELRIMCDGCGHTLYFHVQPTINEAARRLRKLETEPGWRTGQRGDKDYCPKCKQQPAEKRKDER